MAGANSVGDLLPLPRDPAVVPRVTYCCGTVTYCSITVTTAGHGFHENWDQISSKILDLEVDLNSVFIWKSLAFPGIKSLVDLKMSSDFSKKNI